MSVERLDFLIKHGVQIPYEPEKITEFAVFKVLVNLAWHSDIDGYVWVSDRTQALELRMSRSTVWVARRLLEREKWLIDTGNRKQKGVKVYKLVIPNYLPSGLPIQTTNELSGLDSGLTSGLATGSPSGLVSGLPSGSTSGLFCGLPYQAEKNIKENENEKKLNNQFEKKADLSYLPENVQEIIKRKRRSRGINTENGEISLGEAVKSVFDNMQNPNTDQQNNTER